MIQLRDIAEAEKLMKKLFQDCNYNLTHLTQCIPLHLRGPCIIKDLDQWRQTF